MSVKNRERQIFEPRISRTYIIIYSDVPWVFLDHLEILFLWKRFHVVSKDIMVLGLKENIIIVKKYIKFYL